MVELVVWVEQHLVERVLLVQKQLELVQVQVRRDMKLIRSEIRLNWKHITAWHLVHMEAARFRLVRCVLLNLLVMKLVAEKTLRPGIC